MIDTARLLGCLVGALAGDALGSQVEFKPRQVIAQLHPDGLHEIGPSSVWRTLAGQPTDDGELTLALLAAVVGMGTAFDAAVTMAHYRRWFASRPFDIGNTTRQALSGATLNQGSQANGALMRQAPLAVWAGVRGLTLEQLDQAVAADTRLTHPHPACVLASQCYARGLVAYLAGGSLADASAAALAAPNAPTRPDVGAAICAGLAGKRPEYDPDRAGWVLVALQNAWHQAAHAPDIECGLVDTVMQGGDTDTNACIAGALLGARDGIGGIPVRWVETVRACTPGPGSPQPRPGDYWPGRAWTLLALLQA